MKKLTAMLCAATLCCTALAAPVQAAAEETYQLGDVNMDGKVDIRDAKLLLNEYVRVELTNLPGELTEEQIALGNVNGKSSAKGNPITKADAYIVLWYNTAMLVHFEVDSVEDYIVKSRDPNSVCYVPYLIEME